MFIKYNIQIDKRTQEVKARKFKSVGFHMLNSTNKHTLTSTNIP